MALSLNQVLKQTQKLIMTPQMQQSIQLLQLNSMELEQMISSEMMENPFLELSDDEENLASSSDNESGDDERADGEKTLEADSGLSDEEREKSAAAETDDPPVKEEKDTSAENTEAEPADKSADSEEFESFNENDVNWDEEYRESDSISYSSTREDHEEHDFTTYTALSDSLYDALTRQMRLSVLEGHEVEIAEFIIGNLDERGFLDCSIENLAKMLRYPADLVDLKGGKESEPALRKLLLRINGKESEEHYKQLNRKQLVATVIGKYLGMMPDEAMAMSHREQLQALIAKRLKRSTDEVAQTPEEDLVLECIAWRMKSDAQTVFDVLEVIQDFEPTGVGARGLAECLRLQAEEQGIRNRLLYRILDEHLADLQQKRFREIARAIEVPESEVTEVFHLIARLDPRPGLRVSRDSPRYITPDVYVKKIDDKYMYFLNEGDAGKLRIASNYRRLIVNRQRRARAEAAKNGTPLEKPTPDQDYAHEKYKNAVWLIKNIEKRKSTVLRVTEAIMNYQGEFLEKGVEHLRPLTLRNIAEVVGMHESTIARVTTGKYVETPRGIFELKYFFSSGLETDTGEDASSRSIKEIITKMIDAEDPAKPLSDQKIADMLKEKGINIARRTVAKYREQLKILPAKLRKNVG